MKTCPICKKSIKIRTVIDGKVVNCQRRKYCFECSPFGSGNNKSSKCNAIASSKKTPKEKNKDQYRKYQKEMRAKRKHELVVMLGGQCSICGYNRSEKALDFHHRKGTKKKFNLAALGYTCAWDRLVTEAKKCMLLCANCHREITE